MFLNVNALAWTEGQTVYWDPVNLAPIANGLIRIGKCVTTVASSSPTVAIRLLKDARESHQAIVGPSTALTNTTTATLYSQSIVVPQNYLQVGDILKIRAQVLATGVNSTNTLQCSLMLGGVALVAGPAVNNAVNDIVYFDAEITITAIGASGTLVGCGAQADGTPGTVTAKPFGIAPTTAINTTQNNTLGVQGTYSVANAGNTSALEYLSCQLLRA